MEIPFELFIAFIGMSLAMAVFGFLRNPQIPAMVCFGGIFILMVAVVTDGVIMGKIPVASASSGSTTTYTFEDNVFPFDNWSKTLFAFMGGIMMLLGALMVGRA